jgi:hypothetical protein
LVKDLERTLETLTKYSELDWTQELDYNKDGVLHIGKKFVDYKTKVNSVREALEKYFNKTMTSIANGIPEVAKSTTDDDTDYNF